MTLTHVGSVFSLLLIAVGVLAPAYAYPPEIPDDFIPPVYMGDTFFDIKKSNLQLELSSTNDNHDTVIKFKIPQASPSDLYKVYTNTFNSTGQTAIDKNNNTATFVGEFFSTRKYSSFPQQLEVQDKQGYVIAQITMDIIGKNNMPQQTIDDFGLWKNGSRILVNDKYEKDHDDQYGTYHVDHIDWVLVYPTALFVTAQWSTEDHQLEPLSDPDQIMKLGSHETKTTSALQDGYKEPYLDTSFTITNNYDNRSHWLGD